MSAVFEERTSLLVLWTLSLALAACGCEGGESSFGWDPASLPSVVAPEREGWPGSAASPLPVGTFPYTHRGSTATGAESRVGSYGCAPAVRERGPEVHYELTLDREGLLRAWIESGEGVDVDVHLLRSDARTCLARGDRELARSLSPGAYRIVVDTSGGAGPYRLDLSFEPPEPVHLGFFWNTYYYLAQERDHEGPAGAPLLSGDCDILADVPLAFHDDLCIEGSGLLRDGRVVNYDSSCTQRCLAALPCGRRRRYKICYRVLDSERYPWGMGVQGRPLEPDISVAVDRRLVPLGAVLYLPELDGVVPPGRSEPHDGCVRADDIGGAIRGKHLDIFVGSRGRWRAWERIFPTRSWFAVILHHPRCSHLAGGGVRGRQ